MEIVILKKELLEDDAQKLLNNRVESIRLPKFRIAQKRRETDMMVGYRNCNAVRRNIKKSLN